MAEKETNLFFLQYDDTNKNNWIQNYLEKRKWSQCIRDINDPKNEETLFRRDIIKGYKMLFILYM